MPFPGNERESVEVPQFEEQAIVVPADRCPSCWHFIRVDLFSEEEAVDFRVQID